MSASHCPYALYRAPTPGYTGMEVRREPTCVEDKGMHLQRQWWSGLVAAVLLGLVGVTAVAAAGAQFLPILGVREGANRFIQIPIPPRSAPRLLATAVCRRRLC